MTFVTLATDENGTPVSSHTVSAEVEVDPTSARWRGPFRIEIASPSGDARGGFEGIVSATRIVAQPGPVRAGAVGPTPDA